MAGYTIELKLGVARDLIPNDTSLKIRVTQAFVHPTKECFHLHNWWP